MKKSIVAILCFISMAGAVFTQAQPEKTEGLESRAELEKMQPTDSLEAVHFTRRAEELRSRNLKDIHTLSTIVKNFGDKVQGSKELFEKVKNDYKTALRYYYRRAGFLAGKKMEDNRNDIRELYSKFSNYYELKTDEMLTKCADGIVTIQQNEMLGADRESNLRLRDLSRNELKLKIAYSQMALADGSNRNANFKQALVHYRIAKEYGISILANMGQTDDEKKKVMEEYRVDMLDNKNMTQAASSASAAPAQQ